MIEVFTSLPAGSGARLRLRPPRALTARQFVTLFAVLAGAMWLVALMGWLAGNVYAPGFALLHSVMVAAALCASWRNGERSEVISIGPERVEVHQPSRSAPVFTAHPYWVQLRVEEGGERISLASSGNRIEVGNLLGPAERLELAEKLQGLLAAAKTAATDDALGSRQ
ncbi:membrane protein [Pseudoxanthomonas dokdonensis]|uniref:Membrane protein n=1 Tax=Pseudoxanthomonas dokdonensis TaxID=344882 RepID=A0A0R0CSY7_9GAMM|nr:DUF2244 domain-containing protein [Pseudoxanthomonas dokdonensis]KRG68355.1 membrane protein [Pseudoxanthomonas dokdonensis]